MGEPPKNPAARPRLGRGLSSLLSSLTGAPLESATYAAEQAIRSGPKAPIAVALEGARQVAIDVLVEQIGPNPYQPRRDFPQEELEGLAASIAKHGLLQPIRVTRASDGASTLPYILVAGERRLRATKMASLKTIPCVVSDATPEQMLQWALIENVHRSDLNPIERGEAYLQFLNRFGLTQADLAESLGEARPTIANYLRILDLHSDVRAMVSGGALTFGHAKVLAGLVGKEAQQVGLARKAQKESLSVRQLEAMVAQLAEGVAPEGAVAAPRARPAYIRDLEERLSTAAGTRVWIRPGRARNTGKVVIEYYSLDDFDRLASMLGVAPGQV